MVVVMPRLDCTSACAALHSSWRHLLASQYWGMHARACECGKADKYIIDFSIGPSVAGYKQHPKVPSCILGRHQGSLEQFAQQQVQLPGRAHMCRKLAQHLTASLASALLLKDPPLDARLDLRGRPSGADRSSSSLDSSHSIMMTGHALGQGNPDAYTDLLRTSIYMQPLLRARAALSSWTAYACQLLQHIKRMDRLGWHVMRSLFLSAAEG